MKDGRENLIAALKDGIFALRTIKLEAKPYIKKINTRHTAQATCNNRCQRKGRAIGTPWVRPVCQF